MNSKTNRAKRWIALLAVLVMLFSAVPAQSAGAGEQTPYDFQGMKENFVKLLTPSDITVVRTAKSVDDGEYFLNRINTEINGLERVEFDFTFKAGMNQFDEEMFLGVNFPQVNIYQGTYEQSRGKAPIASYQEGRGDLKYFGYVKDPDTNVKTRITIGTDGDVLKRSGVYTLVFGPNIRGNNEAKLLGVPVAFEFTIKGKFDLPDILDKAKAALESAQIGGGSGQYPQEAADRLKTAIAEAQAQLENPNASGEEKAAAADRLTDALDTFEAQRVVNISSLTVSGVPKNLTVGQTGKAEAAVSVSPNEERYKGVNWTASENITINRKGEWCVNYEKSGSFVAAETVTLDSASGAAKKVELPVNVSAASADGALLVNVPAGQSLRDMVTLAAGNPGSVKKLKVMTSKHVSLVQDDIRWMRDNLKAAESLDLSQASIPSFPGSAFAGCTALQKIRLPETLTEIPTQCFKGCTNLSDITIPARVKNVAYEAFKDCTNLSDTIEVFGVYPPAYCEVPDCFNGVKKTFVVPYGCKEVYQKAPGWKKHVIEENSRGEVKLKADVIYSGGLEDAADAAMSRAGIKHSNEVNTLTVDSLGDSKVALNSADIAYLKENFLNAASIDLSGVELEGKDGDIGGNIQSETFKDRVCLKKIRLPENTGTLGKRAFYGCSSLQDIILPPHLVKIGDGAFRYCERLPEELILESAEPPNYDGNPFDEGQIKSIAVPVQSVEKYKKALGWRSSGIKFVPQVTMSMDRTSLSLDAGSSRTLTASVHGKGSYANVKPAVTWSSSDKLVAKVTSSGKVTAVQPGTVVITASAKSLGIKATCKVTVKGLPAPKAKAASVSYNSVKISWNGVSGAAGYEVQRSLKKTGGWSAVRTMSSSSRSLVDTGRTTGKTYYYRVRAYKTVNGVRYKGNYSPVMTAKPVPAKPGSVKAVRGGTKKIKVSWKKSQEHRAMPFIVHPPKTEVIS